MRIFRIFCLLSVIFLAVITGVFAEGESVLYKGHVENIGWQDFVKDGETAGTTGQALRVEALQSHLENVPADSHIEYSAHVENIGWQGYAMDNQTGGTTGQALRVEAIKIRLSGPISTTHDVYYRTHSEDYGWLDWASNDQIAGTTGYCKRMEAIEIKILPKGSPAPGSTQNPSVIKPEVQAAQPGLRTVKNFLKTAMLPVGQTCYVWGGGWNEADNGAGPAAVHIGVYPNWKSFFDSQNANYDYNNTRYQIMNGLDCSGYVGWVVYNTLNTQDNGAGEVYWADDMAKWFSDKEYGTYVPSSQIGSTSEYRPGDIVSLVEGGHVYISLGTCSDGSLLVAHSSPPGVMLSGVGEEGVDNQAKQLARQYMSKYFPEYYNRYNSKMDRKASDYLNNTEKFTWGNNFVGDPDGIRNLSAPEVLKVLFDE